MTYNELWRPLTAIYEEQEAKAIARLVLEKRFGLSLADVLMGQTGDEQELLRIQQRLLHGEPVQYVLGEAEFCDLTFHVEKGVLIPRPETQWLCDCVSNHWGFLPEEGRILDIGTGSGCIACTIAYDLKDAPVEVVAWDISDDALRIARDNAKRLGVKVRFEKQDIFKAPDDKDCWDAIVSNPPYICDSERQQMATHVLDYEPSLALFVPDDDPLRFYRPIADYAIRALRPEGFLLVEINERYGEETAGLFVDKGFTGVTIYEDLYGKDRFVKGFKL